MRTYGWRAQIEVGERGVRRVAQYLRSHGYEVEDVAEDKDFQSQDIDLRVRGQRKQRWRTVEVKTDTYESGNVFLELKSSTGTPGCVFKSRAQWWLYYLPALGVLLFINLPKLQLWLMENEWRYERKEVGSRRGRGKWSVEGIALPWTELVSEGLAAKVKLEDTDETSVDRAAA